ncbi:MAG TPA: DegT/DnrJ/EryC1/StrS family aminotransferase [Pseudomonadota bacterium]|jgi:perosamine synthetase|nr:DegT/DnrJ/EryC1/StrS family aminotransferase [Pseudomonadota bacterium]
MTQRIPVNEPWISDAAKHWVAEVVESGFVSSAGPMVAKFESAFAGFLGVEHALATNSGTSALHLALLALGVGPGDEVIVPDFTMIATVNAVLYCGATPVFVDVEPDTFTLDPRMVEGVITLRTRAIVVVHVYGHSADMDPIMAMARGHGLSVVEDAAEAHGARYRGRLCGGLADIAAFSFYGNKLITTGEGGMVVTQDARLADRVRSLRDMAHDPAKRFRHLELGFSYRMGSLQAALGFGQLQHVDELLARKQRMAAHYRRRLAAHSSLLLPVTREWAENVHWMFAVLLEPSARLTRHEFCAALRALGVDTRDFFVPCSAQPFLQAHVPAGQAFPVANDIAERGCYLPSGLALSDAQIDAVADAIDEVLA